MKIWSPMLHQLLSRSPDCVRTLLIVLLALLALLGIVICGHIFLVPLAISIKLWPSELTRWSVCAMTCLFFGFLAWRSMKAIRSVWGDARAIAIDQIMFVTGCVIWSAAAVIIAIRL